MDIAPNTSPQAVLKRLIAGDPKAFEEILTQYEKPIFNHLLRLTQDYDDASELLQTTFIKVYTKRSHIDPAGSFKNWLYKIATNVAYDFFRKKKREQLVFLDDESVFETIEGDTAYSTIDTEIAVHDLKEALVKIRPHHRTILLLYYKEELSYAEIADILGLPINTVKTHLRRAKIELETFLKNND
ncbi:MAG: hypothetical protein RLZZ347_218 [Candidatus Parcubacteria bacterium]|jgi:RNA polymerase sigma-70 factor (ECF subfamily)